MVRFHLRSLHKNILMPKTKWVKTNKGSSFHVDTGAGFKQVGVTGVADGLLKDG